MPAAHGRARERRALTASIIATTALGLLGVVWGIISGSQMILLDGVYGVIGTATSWMLLRASAVAAREPSRSYPFGRQAVTPLVIGIQGIILLATLLYAAVEALFTIRDGGSEILPGPAVLYGVIITAACFAVWAWLRRQQGHSDLLTAEATAWRIAVVRGAGMIAGFTVLWLLDGSGWHDAGPYIDPAMVLLTCALLMASPISMVRGTTSELLEGAPPPHVQAAVHDAMAATTSAFDLGETDVRAHKLGSKLYVEIAGYASPDATIAQEHAAREHLRARLAGLPYEVWLTFELYPRA